MYPDGLANSSGAVGRYLMDHPSVRTPGTLKSDTTGTPATVNLAKATYNALKNASQSRTPQRAREVRQEVRE